MELKYVGALPVVSEKGVGFDQSQQDKYLLLNAVVELLEAFSFGASETTQHLHNIRGKEYTSNELLSLLKQYCNNLDGVVQAREEKTDILKSNLIKRVHEHEHLSEDGRQAWLNNIELMSEYYYQYVTNEAAYQCALQALADEMDEAKIQEVTFPMFRNYGLVLHDLEGILLARKSPIDSVLTIETGADGLYGKLVLSHD